MRTFLTVKDEYGKKFNTLKYSLSHEIWIILKTNNNKNIIDEIYKD